MEIGREEVPDLVKMETHQPKINLVIVLIVSCHVAFVGSLAIGNESLYLGKKSLVES